MPLIMETPAIKIVFLGQGRATQLQTLFTDIRGFASLELSGTLIFAPQWFVWYSDLCSIISIDHGWLY